MSKSGLKLDCNVKIVYGNLKSETSKDYAKKPQRNCTFMNSASRLKPSILRHIGNLGESEEAVLNKEQILLIKTTILSYGKKILSTEKDIRHKALTTILYQNLSSIHWLQPGL